MTLPDVDPLPESLQEGAAWIWKWQDRLNTVAMSIGSGTIAIGLGNDKSLQRDTLQKFLRAFAAEFTENMENFYWKHWSKECREGRYFQLVETGDQLRENRAQNVKVELVDMLFFLVSYLQVAGYPEERWTIHWGNDARWNSPRDGFSPATNRAVVDLTMECLFLLGGHMQTGDRSQLGQAIVKLRDACSLLYSWQTIHEAYARKLAINFERQARGRQQVGDTISERENQRV
jgi:hypothetical protein